MSIKIYAAKLQAHVESSPFVIFCNLQKKGAQIFLASCTVKTCVHIRTYNFASQPGFLNNEYNGLVLIKWQSNWIISACRFLIHQVIIRRVLLYEEILKFPQWQLLAWALRNAVVIPTTVFSSLCPYARSSLCPYAREGCCCRAWFPLHPCVLI